MPKTDTGSRVESHESRVEDSKVEDSKVEDSKVEDPRPETKIKGSKPPHGGRWVYDEDRDELTCVEKPTKER